MRKCRPDWLSRKGKKRAGSPVPLTPTPYEGGGVGVRGSPAVDLAVQPGAGVNPVALDGGGGDAQGLGRLLKGQAGEVAELDQPGLERLLGLELPQGFVQRQEVFGRVTLRRGEQGARVQVHAPQA